MVDDDMTLSRQIDSPKLPVYEARKEAWDVRN